MKNAQDVINYWRLCKRIKKDHLAFRRRHAARTESRGKKSSKIIPPTTGNAWPKDSMELAYRKL